MPPATADALRSALAVADRSSVGRAYREPLRRAAVAYTIDARTRGESITSISIALGVPTITLLRWLRAAATSPFRTAVVVEPALPSPSLEAWRSAAFRSRRARPTPRDLAERIRESRLLVSEHRARRTIAKPRFRAIASI